MRILFWSETFWPRVGGVERLATALLDGLRARGHEFAVVTWADPHAAGDDAFNGIPVYRRPFFTDAGSAGAATVMEHLAFVSGLKRRFAPDLVHVNSFGRSVWFHLNTAAAADAPTLVTLHQPLAAEVVAPDSVASRLLARSQWVACCSRAVLQSLREVAPDTAGRSSVITNALPGAETLSRASPPPPARLLFAGRLVPEKGLDLLLESLPAVVARFPAATLTVAGDGPSRQSLEARARRLTIDSKVQFLGEQSADDVSALIEGAAMVIVPSRVEGFGLIALEAALRGRPVVATRVGGLMEVVRDGETGWLVDPEDPAALADAISRLIEHPSLATRLGQAARQHARAAFDWDRHVALYDDLYARIGALTAGAR